jgi:cysteine desulfurase family protein
MKEADAPTIYLDNAATSHPKAPGVAEAMVNFLEQIDANPGRSAHRRSIDAGRVIHSAREVLARLFDVRDPMRVVFTMNATEALNLVLHGLLRPGDHVITSSMEHNSVMRPLRALERERIEVTAVQCESDGSLDPTGVESAIRSNTSLIVLNHASNVIGTLMPVPQVGAIARRHDLLLLVDAAQTAGAFPIDLEGDQIDLLAFTGHKTLYGPTGTGGLILGERVDPTRIRPLKQGGTGSRSEREEHPDFLPDLFEAGTANTVGLAGLDAGVRWVLGHGVDAIRSHQRLLIQRMTNPLQEIPNVSVYGPADADRQMAPVSFNVDGMEPSEVGRRLDYDYGVLCRVGLHCAPAAHRTIGTFPEGTVRLAVGAFTTTQDIDRAVAAVGELAAGVA